MDMCIYVYMHTYIYRHISRTSSVSMSIAAFMVPGLNIKIFTIYIYYTFSNAKS